MTSPLLISKAAAAWARSKPMLRSMDTLASSTGAAVLLAGLAAGWDTDEDAAAEEDEAELGVVDAPVAGFTLFLPPAADAGRPNMLKSMGANIAPGAAEDADVAAGAVADLAPVAPEEPTDDDPAADVAAVDASATTSPCTCCCCACRRDEDTAALSAAEPFPPPAPPVEAAEDEEDDEEEEEEEEEDEFVEAAGFPLELAVLPSPPPWPSSSPSPSPPSTPLGISASPRNVTSVSEPSVRKRRTLRYKSMQHW